jgi:hypothetical protein
MKLSLPILALALATGLSLAACAQQTNAAENGSGASPEMRAQMQQARDNAKTAALNDLSAGDRAKVQAILDQVNNGQQTDLRAAAQQIDAILSPDESKAVLGERDKMMAAIRANMPAGQAPGGAGGHPQGAMGGHRMNDAGSFFLRVSISPEKMRALRQAQAKPQ